MNHNPAVYTSSLHSIMKHDPREIAEDFYDGAVGAPQEIWTGAYEAFLGDSFKHA